jgi:3',5'-cyclic AMP phosphodiesterase CpdA
MLIVQISDFHVAAPGARSAGTDAAATLALCVRNVARMDPPPDVVLATGDLAEQGKLAEYRRVRELLAALAVPVYIIPGNHDDRKALRTAFADHAYLRGGEGSIYYALEDYDLGLIALDTLVPAADGGKLDALQLAWLEATLRRLAGRELLVFMHHPPIMTGIRCMDEIALEPTSVARLGDLVAQHGRVERIVCGHVHRSIQARWNGTLVSICPSTAYQGILNLRGDMYDAATAEPPGYQVHYWNGTDLITHTVAVMPE